MTVLPRANKRELVKLSFSVCIIQLVNLHFFASSLGYRCGSRTPIFGGYCSPLRPALLPKTQQQRSLGVANRSYPSSSPSAKIQLGMLGLPVCEYHELSVPTKKSVNPHTSQAPTITVQDLTPSIRKLLHTSGLKQGAVTVISRHTTTAITINESESRLARDMEQYLLQLAPPDERILPAGNYTRQQEGVRYLHNDIEQRPESEEEKQRCLENGWDIHNPQQLQAWRDQEPINAHSHLLSMLLGSSESIPVVNCSMVIGQWQSILLVDLDPGPRDYRTVGVQLTGFQ